MKPWLSRVVLAVSVAACDSANQVTDIQPLRLDLEGRYGSLEGALGLRGIRGLVLTQGIGDTVLVNQVQVPGILLMSAAGDSLGMIGRGGSGPGEFRAPWTPSIRADTIWVPDVSGIIQRFDARGEHIDQLAPGVAPLGPFQYAPRFRAALADGSLLMQGVSNPVGEEARAAVQALALVRVHRNWEVMDTVALLSIRESGYVLRFPDGSGIVGSHPATNPDLGAVDPEGRWVVVAAQEIDELDRFGFTLRWIEADGDTLAERFVTTEPISTEPIRQAWIGRLVDTEGRPRGMIEAAVADVPFPTHQAPALALFADAEGRAWVRSPHVSSDSTRWYVVDTTAHLSSIVLENQVELLAARGDIAWGWTRGPFDEPYLLKFRIGT